MEALFWSLEDQRRAIARRELSSRQLVEASLERIEQLHASLRAFISVTAERALAEADERDRDVARGAELGPLHGLPYAVKDNVETAGVRTTAASGFMREHVPAADAEVVTRLRAAGGVLLGKLNMHEWASGVTSESAEFGTVANPLDPSRIPGGSSSGSAVAVATGQVSLAIGTDTGGSVRMPASLCGVVGFKPTTGRVSTRGVLPWSWTLDHVGPLARSVRDVATAFGVMAGHDALDPGSTDRPSGGFADELENGIEGFRLAVPRSFFATAEAEVQAAFDAALHALEAAGATWRDVEWPELEASVEAHKVIVDADIAAYHRARFEANPGGFSDDLRRRLERGRGRTAMELAIAQRSKQELSRAFVRRFDAFDAVVLPTTPIVAPVRAGLDGARTSDLLASLVRPFSLVAAPAISVPIGRAGGLPVGLQVATAPWTESRLLRIARSVEQAVGQVSQPLPA